MKTYLCIELSILLKMIRTVADLLHKFAEAENEILREQDIKHPPTIGNMWEGLTAEVLSKAIDSELGLKIIRNSFIEGCYTEFDVMLVEGEGEQIRYTSQYKYPIEQVIAIISVKKNFYSGDLHSGFSNLQFVDNYYNDIDLPFSQRLSRDAIKTLLNKDLDAVDWHGDDGIFADMMKKEANLPVRIVWGYNGFTSEYSLRESFYEMMTVNLTTDLDNPILGYGPLNIPNLIICGRYSLIKTEGMPFISALDENRWWNMLVSSSKNPIYFLLEKIWNRLTYRYNISDEIFGDDLAVDNLYPFLRCRLNHIENFIGWDYEYMPIEREDLTFVEDTNWEPVEIHREQFGVIHTLLKIGEIDLENDPHITAYVTKSGKYLSLNEFIDELCKTKITYKKGSRLRLLTDVCGIVSKEGKVYVGENKSGRLTRWAETFAI